MDESDDIILRAMAEFPSLARYAHQYREEGKPFDIARFRRDFYAGRHGSGAEHAFRFICHLWDPASAMQDVGAFCVISAMGAWDVIHQRAFATWVLRPERP